MFFRSKREWLCEKITRHRFRGLTRWSVGVKPTEYHYKCKVCGFTFWNHKAPKSKRGGQESEFR